MVSRISREISPLEQDGIRYEEIRIENYEPFDRRSGWMRARDIASGEVRWEVQVYSVSYDETLSEALGLPTGPAIHDCFFERFRWMSDRQHILIENQFHRRYLVNIHTREVRPATDDDFAPEQIYQRRKPTWLEPIVWRNTLYFQDLRRFFNGTTQQHYGILVGRDIHTREYVFNEQIYQAAPYRDELEHYVPESYFVEFGVMPSGRDLYISNQDEEVYFFDVRERKVWQAPPDVDPYAYCDQMRRNWRARLRFFFIDIWDWITRRRY